MPLCPEKAHKTEQAGPVDRVDHADRPPVAEKGKNVGTYRDPRYPRVRGVYALVDPRDDKVRYVGSSIHVHARFRAHLTSGTSSSDKGRFAAFVLPLRREGKEPVFVLLEEVEAGRDLTEAEYGWIAKFKAEGQADLNKLTKFSDQMLRIRALEAEVKSLRAKLGLS